MPKQKRKQAENTPVSFRPGALQRHRLNELIDYRQQNQSTVINAALDLLWLLDIGYCNLEQLKTQTDILTSYGKNDPEE
jgi:hypothetical protein